MVVVLYGAHSTCCANSICIYIYINKVTNLVSNTHASFFVVLQKTHRSLKGNTSERAQQVYMFVVYKLLFFQRDMPCCVLCVYSRSLSIEIRSNTHTHMRTYKGNHLIRMRKRHIVICEIDMFKYTVLRI